ncbi:ATP-binding protein [Jatrophihabitans sp. YIM 134969]
MTAAATPDPASVVPTRPASCSRTPRDDGDTVVLALSADATAVVEARRFVADRWCWLDGVTLSDVELVVYELVTNAVRHGRPDIELRLRVEPFALDVAVLDHGSDDIPDDTAVSGTTSPTGRGLAIVDRLSSFWGVEPATDGAPGKVVWASITRRR